MALDSHSVVSPSASTLALGFILRNVGVRRSPYLD